MNLNVGLDQFVQEHPQHRIEITRRHAPELSRLAGQKISQELQKLVHGGTVPSMSTPAVPISSVQGIESLILFGLQVFTQIFSLFVHPTNPVPVAAAPALIQQIQATPGITADHQAVAAAAVNAAVEARKLTQTA